VELIGQYGARWLLARRARPGRNASVIDPAGFDWREPTGCGRPRPASTIRKLRFLIQFTSVPRNAKSAFSRQAQFADWSLAAAQALGLSANDRLRAAAAFGLTWSA